MDASKIQVYAHLIQDTLNRNTPISNEQFDYFLKINELPILKNTPKLSYQPIRNTALPYSGQWEISANIKDGITPNELEKTLIDNNIIQNKEEINIRHYQPNKGKIDSGISGYVENPKLKINVSFFGK